MVKGCQDDTVKYQRTRVARNKIPQLTVKTAWQTNVPYLALNRSGLWVWVRMWVLKTKIKIHSVKRMTFQSIRVKQIFFSHGQNCPENKLFTILQHYFETYSLHRRFLHTMPTVEHICTLLGLCLCAWFTNSKEHNF